MKKLFSFLCLFFICSNLSAQRTQETIYLHNGSIIKGEVLEQIPNSSIKVQTADGSIFVYQMSEVEKIAKEKVEPSRKEGRHRGLDFSIDAGYNIATKGGSGNISAEIGLGKRFNKNFYWGISSGAHIPTSSGNPSIPITSDFKVYFPLKSSSLTPGGIIRAGYLINTSDDITTGSGKNKTTIEIPDHIMIQIMPTIEIPLSKRIDLNVGLGYTHFVPTKGSGSSGAFSIKTGFTFHKSPISNASNAKSRKPKIPTRDKGMQLTVEGGNNIIFGSDEHRDVTCALALTYKLNPQINLGLGLGANYFTSYVEDGNKYTATNKKGQTSQGYQEIDMDGSVILLFVRGVYRLNNKRFSPFVTCDSGMRFYSTVDYYTSGECEVPSSSTGIFVAPAVGLSLRTTNNSYLELKAGYSLASGVKVNGAEYDSGQTHYQVDSYTLKMSAPFISLGFTHTFSWGENWGK